MKLTDWPVPADSDYDIEPDPGIRDAVRALQRGGVETYESCEGGEGHAFPEPTVRFGSLASLAEGWYALAVAQIYGLKPYQLRQVWTINEGRPVGPFWEMTFAPSGKEGGDYKEWVVARSSRGSEETEAVDEVLTATGRRTRSPKPPRSRSKIRGK